MEGNQKRKGDFGEISSSKRSKNDDDFKGVQPSRFESELASLQSSDAGTSIVHDPKAKWKRPALPVINPGKDSLEFQQLDVDNYIGRFYAMYNCSIYNMQSVPSNLILKISVILFVVLQVLHILDNALYL